MTIIPLSEHSEKKNLVNRHPRTGLVHQITTRSPPNAAKDNLNAIVYCEGNFGKIDGKTANGLIRHSEKYKILAVIDSTQSGSDSGELLDNVTNGIPIHTNLVEAFAKADTKPDYFIYGMAPATGMLSAVEREVILGAIRLGMNIVNGLHEFLNDDPQFLAASKFHKVKIIDIRRPREKNALRLFTGNINDIVTCPTIAVLGTDCAIGKRTTANILRQALVERGINAILINTGQTGLIQGSKYGVALDAVPSQFCCGELEATIIEAYYAEAPDVIIVEGQGALSHPAFCTSAFILKGSVPDGVILQHAPKRKFRCDFDGMLMPRPNTEIPLIETFANTKVIGLTINHENMNDLEIDESILEYQDALGIPVTDALARPIARLVDMVGASFPQLAEKLSESTQ